MADMLRTSWSGFTAKLEQSLVEPVLLRTATIDAVTNSEQHDTWSDLSYILLSVVTERPPQRLLWAMHIKYYRLE